MQFNAIMSLIKSNSMDEAKSLLEQSFSKPEFKNSQNQNLLASVQAYIFIKDKKY